MKATFETSIASIFVVMAARAMQSNGALNGCEATRRLGDQASVLMPDQPCADIRGLGNRLRHAYDRVSAGVIWDTVTGDLPGLRASATRASEQLQRGHAPDDPASGVTHS